MLEEIAADKALSVNIARRHLTKGQQAMLLAKVRLVSGQNNNGQYLSVRDIASQNSISWARVDQANQVLEYAPDLADSVIAGVLSLDSAYRTAQQRKAEAETLKRRTEPPQQRATSNDCGEGL